MPSYRIPGSLCASIFAPPDAGTACLWLTAAPGSLCANELLSPDTLTASPLRQWHHFSVAKGFAPSLLAVSPEGLDLLKGVEELHLQPYDDQTGNGISTWVKGATIGYGHLIVQSDWGSFKKGLDQAEADALFDADLAPTVETVSDTISVGLQQYEFDALVILAFNIGPKGFKTSSVAKLVNDPKAVTGYANLEAAWKAWKTSQGKVMKGLVNRRACEWKIYTSALYERW